MTPDIATRLRQTRANMLGTDDEQHYWDCHKAASHIELLEAAYKSSGSALAVIDGGFQNAVAEIQRLRLTDAAREAVRFCVTASLPETEKLGGVAGELCRMHAATLRGLLARMSGDGDCPDADNTAEQDNADRSQPIAKRDSDSPQPIADARLAALQQLAELDEELGLAVTSNPHATPDECTVPPQWTEDGEK